MTRDDVLDKREDVLDEFDDRVDPNHRITTLGEQRWYTAQLLADEIVRLRDRLAAVEAERDAEKQRRREIDNEAFVYAEQVEVMRRRAGRAERILAALREPSLKMREAVHDALNARAVTDPIIGEDIDEIIAAAVAAAEKEASA